MPKEKNAMVSFCSWSSLLGCSHPRKGRESYSMFDKVYKVDKVEKVDKVDLNKFMLVTFYVWGLSLLLDSPVRLVHPSPTNWIISSWRMPVSSFSRRNTGDSFFCKINTFLQAPVQLMWQDLSCGREIVMSSRISKPSHGSVTTWATKSTPKAYPDCTLREPLCNGLNHFWFFSFFAT